MRSLSTYECKAEMLSISPAGDILACTRSRRVLKQPEIHRLEFWNLKTGVRLAEFDEEGVQAIAFAPDGSRVMVSVAMWGKPAKLQLYSLPAAVAGASIPIAAPGCSALLFSPDGKLLAKAGVGAIELLDGKTLATVSTLKGPAGAHIGSLHFSPDGKTVTALVSQGTGVPQDSAWRWDLATSAGKRLFDFDHSLRGASYSADGRLLAVHAIWYGFSRKERMELWDTDAGRRVASLSTRPPPWMWSVALSPDGQHLAVGFQSPAPRKAAPIGIWHVK